MSATCICNIMSAGSGVSLILSKPVFAKLHCERTIAGAGLLAYLLCLSVFPGFPSDIVDAELWMGIEPYHRELQQRVCRGISPRSQRHSQPLSVCYRLGARIYRAQS